MHRNWTYRLILTSGLVASLAHAQQSCVNGIRVDGTITDSTGAVIPGAQVRAANGETVTTDKAGHYALPCVPAVSPTITVQAEGFAGGISQARIDVGETAHVNMQLAVASVQTDVQVSGNTASMGTDRDAGTIVLNTNAVQQLADDPDDFLRELQMLAASGGGSSENALIVVDGFQNGSALPPKDSIASIRVNPDLFSSEYESPPWNGGRIEISTKAGAGTYHGGLFFIDSASIFNATDPFSATATPAGKRRYGFELSGPLARQKSDFFLALEKRDIDEFNVINAVTLDSNDNPTPLHQTVAAPQRLWIASTRGDWQITPNDFATLSFSANVNNLGNQGVGGHTLADAGYSSLASEYDLRLLNTQTLSANMLHETRIGYTWKRTEQTPLSTAPSLEVAGYFLGGGVTSGNLNDRERDLEIDDDMMGTQGKHSWKTGVQSLGIFVHNNAPDTFNGAYVFGGGGAPQLDGNNNPTGQVTTITGIEQYRRALLNLPGGAPTAYQVTSGTPLVPLTQWKLALYAQDTIKLASRVSVNVGLRYVLQTSPDSAANFDPRVSLEWSPDKKETWVFGARAGLFSGVINRNYAIESARLNGVRQQNVTVYSPDYSNPLTPVAGSIAVSTIREFPHSFTQDSEFASYLVAEHEFRRHWNLGVHFYFGEDWNVVRTRNINAPMVENNIGLAPDPTAALGAPRPITPNENILQYQNSGHFAGNVLSFVVNQHSYKWFGLYAYYAHRVSKSDGGNGDVSPQSSYSDIGEAARADWASTNGFFLTGNLNLPYGLALSTQFAVQQGTPYNITTGTDNNGDGDFNDRPSYVSAPGAGVYSTPFGLLTTNTVNGDVPRNLGTMPSLIHLDTNLNRIFNLNSRDKAHPQTLTLNLRSANLLNHTNVTAVQTVLSPNLGQPLSAEAGRRLEVGARFAF